MIFKTFVQRRETMWTYWAGFKWEIIVLPTSVSGCLILSTQLKALYPPRNSHLRKHHGTDVSSATGVSWTLDSNYSSNSLFPLPTCLCGPWMSEVGMRSGQHKHNENNGTDIQLVGHSGKWWGSFRTHKKVILIDHYAVKMLETEFSNISTETQVQLQDISWILTVVN